MALPLPWLLLALAEPPLVRPPAPLPPPLLLSPPAPAPGEVLDAGRDTSDRMTVSVRLNGAGPYAFVVDTAADRSVVTRGVASVLGLPVAAPVRLLGIAGLEVVDTVRIASLAVGARTIADVVAPALGRDGVGADGLLGIDALADQRVEMDFAARRMTVSASPPRDPRPAGDTIVVTARRRFGQLILADAAVGGRRIFAVIDTGADTSVANPALRRRIARRGGSIGLPGLLTGVTGRTIVADLAVLPDLRIGGLSLSGVPVAFADLHTFRRFGLADDPALLVGMDVLRLFRRVVVDFGRHQVRFALPPGVGSR